MAMRPAVAARPATGNALSRAENLVSTHWQGRKVTAVGQPAQAIHPDGEALPADSVRR
jgi:hypothetical protein